MSIQPEIQQIDTPDGISWYTESFHPLHATDQDYVVLIPSGEGDCYNQRTVAQLLASRDPKPYNVLTFDMPGFSRTKAPSAAFTKPDPESVAKQIVGLLDALNIPRATVCGCSSGGIFTLGLCAFYPSRVKCGIVHEVPLAQAPGEFASLRTKSDEEITAACEHLFSRIFIEQDANDGLKKWEALGSEYHARLAKNYVTWMRSYVGVGEAATSQLASVPANLQKRPISWTVGSLNKPLKEGWWKEDFVVAEKAGLSVNTERLNCLHFPSVTVPEEYATWIAECDEKIHD